MKFVVNCNFICYNEKNNKKEEGQVLTTSMLLGIFDWIGDFFKSLFNLIPQVVYLLYASLACVIDCLQLLFRKLAGLDVYYVDGEAVAGDLVTNFITGILGINADGFEYSALSTVFWSFIVFGIIICFISTIVAIVKSHYSYDDKAAKGPMQYVYTAGKAVLNIVAVPIIVVLGLYLSQAILTALDSMTSITSGNVEAMYGDKISLLQSVDTSKTATGLESSRNRTYIYYDIFGFGGAIAYGTNADAEPFIADAKELVLIGSSNQTFSGSLFRVAAYNANRVRIGTPMSALSGFGADELFANAATANDVDLGADMVDTAFACNLHLNYTMDLRYITNSTDSNGVWVSFKYFTNFLTQNANAFSKFNVGLVWYYYDLWSFNFIVGFGGCIVCAVLFINIIIGLITRLLMCIGLFLVAPPLFGLAPLDGGKAGGAWRENFMKQVLMAYGAVVGMNIFFLILPYLNQIDFFNIPIADYFAQILVIIVGLITIKAFIATLSGLVGGADAHEVGKGVSEEVGAVAGTALKMTVGAGVGVIKAPVNAYRGAKAVKNKVQESYHGWRENRNKKRADQLQNTTDKETFINQKLSNMSDANLNKKNVMSEAIKAGFTTDEAKQLWSATKASKKAGTWGSAGGSTSVKAEKMRLLKSNLEDRDSEFRKTRRKFGTTAANRKGDLDAARARQNVHSTLRSDSHTRYERYKGGLTGLKDLALTPFRNVNDTLGESKLYSAFKEKSFWKKPDWQKETAENTKKTYQEIQAGRGDMRQGFDTIHGDVQGGFKGAHRDARRIIRGQGGIQSEIASGNAHLQNIEEETRKIQRNTRHISKETDGLKARTVKAAKKQREAVEENKRAKKELKEINKTIKNIDSKL